MNDQDELRTDREPESDDELGAALGEAIANTVDGDPIAPPVVSITTRAAERDRRRRMAQTGGSIAAAAIVLAGGIFGWSTLRDGNEDQVAAVDAGGEDDAQDDAVEPDGPDAAAQDGGGAAVDQGADEAATSDTDQNSDTAEAELVAPDPADLSTGPLLAWESFDGPAALGRLVSLNDGRVAILEWERLGPGGTSVTITSDGRVWEPLTSIPDIDIYTLAAEGDTLVVTGGKPGTAAQVTGADFSTEPDTVVLVSEDSGASWTELELGLPDVVDDGDFVYTNSFVSGVVVHEGTVVVGVGRFSAFSIEEYMYANGLLPTEPGQEIVGMSYGFDNRDTGVEIELANGEQLTFTYEALGLSAEQLASLEAEATEVGELRTSVDGSPFQVTQTVSGSTSDVNHVDGVFIAQAFGEGGPLTLTSPDGITWTEAAGDPTTNWGISDVAYAGSLWAAMVGPEGMEIERSDDGSSWSTTAAFPGLVPSDEIKVGPGGLVLAAQVADTRDFGSDSVPAGSVFKDGYELRFNEPEGGITLFGADGETIRVFSPEEANADDPPEGVEADPDTGELTFFDPDTGDVLFVVAQEEMVQALEIDIDGNGGAVTEPSPDFYEPPETWVGWSLDGTAWGWQRSSAAFGIDPTTDHWVQLAVGDGFVIAQVETFAAFDASGGAGEFEPDPARWFIAETG